LPDMDGFDISLCIASRFDQVRLVRAALSGLLEHLRVIEEDIIALQLAVSEIVNNCIEHGYKGAGDSRIEIRLHAQETTVQIDLVDWSSPFPEDQRYRLMDAPLSSADSSEDQALRGRGLKIVRQAVDSVELASSGSQNVLTLRKQVSLLERRNP
jgi:anti-sigma regulatory factor (Ser/Thr protein kinase)